MDERERQFEQWEAWANDPEPDMTDGARECAAWQALHEDRELPDGAGGCGGKEGGGMKRVIREAFKEPLPWWISPGMVGAGVVGNLWDLGLSLAIVRGGLVGGVVGILLVCWVRRALVGPWRSRAWPGRGNRRSRSMVSVSLRTSA
jgi:hypothetical protein